MSGSVKQKAQELRHKDINESERSSSSDEGDEGVEKRKIASKSSSIFSKLSFGNEIVKGEAEKVDGKVIDDLEEQQNIRNIRTEAGNREEKDKEGKLDNVLQSESEENYIKHTEDKTKEDEGDDKTESSSSDDDPGEEPVKKVCQAKSQFRMADEDTETEQSSSFEEDEEEMKERAKIPLKVKAKVHSKNGTNSDNKKEFPASRNCDADPAEDSDDESKVEDNKPKTSKFLQKILASLQDSDQFETSGDEGEETSSSSSYSEESETHERMVKFACLVKCLLTVWKFGELNLNLIPGL